MPTRTHAHTQDMPSTTLIDENGNFVTLESPDAMPNGDAVEEDHHDFLVDHWMDVAAASFYGFKKYGIGAVIVAEGDPAQAEVDHPFGARKLLYGSERSVWIQNKADALPDGWLDDQLQTYDPNEVAIVMMADEDGTIRAYTIKGEPDPKRCFEITRSQMN